MTAKDLIANLSVFAPEGEVVCYCEEPGIVPPKHSFRLFDITAVESQEAQKVRGADRVPSLRLGKSSFSSPHVLIHITADF